MRTESHALHGAGRHQRGRADCASSSPPAGSARNRLAETGSAMPRSSPYTLRILPKRSPCRLAQCILNLIHLTRLTTMKAQTIYLTSSRLSGIIACLAMVPLAHPLMAMEIHVAPVGKDTNPGTRQSPLATLEAARDAVRKQIAGGMKEDITVHLGAGNYFIEKPVVFDDRDSGRDGHTITYQGRAQPGHPHLWRQAHHRLEESQRQRRMKRRCRDCRTTTRSMKTSRRPTAGFSTSSRTRPPATGKRKATS